MDAMEIRRTFGENITNLRLSKGYADGNMIAKRLSVPYTTYMAWERGARFPRIDILLALADYYGVSLDSLFSRSGAEISSDFNDLSPEDKLYVYRTIKMLKNAKKDPAE